MAWDRGFNFRSTSGYVTDIGDDTYVIGDSYPTTRANPNGNSATFGWTGSISKADRNSATNAKLAGINYSAALRTFQVDLPSSGDYSLRLALGDFSASQTLLLVFQDGATPLATIGPHTTGAGQIWYDASDVSRGSVALWVANNVAITKTFATSTLNVVIGNAVNNTTIAHLFVSQISASASVKQLAALGVG